MDKFSWG